jgi:hypothetical protein
MTDIHSCSYYCDRPKCIKAQRDELRDKLAQSEQEPVAKHYVDGGHLVYPAAQRPWVGLTPKQIAEIVIYPMNKTADLVQAIDAKLRENNGY